MQTNLILSIISKEISTDLHPMSICIFFYLLITTHLFLSFMNRDSFDVTSQNLLFYWLQIHIPFFYSLTGSLLWVRKTYFDDGEPKHLEPVRIISTFQITRLRNLSKPQFIIVNSNHSIWISLLKKRNSHRMEHAKKFVLTF